MAGLFQDLDLKPNLWFVNVSGGLNDPGGEKQFLLKVAYLL